MAFQNEKKEHEAKDSYLKVEQYDFISDKILTVKRRINGQQNQIEAMERKMLTLIKRRDEKNQMRLE